MLVSMQVAQCVRLQVALPEKNKLFVPYMLETQKRRPFVMFSLAEPPFR